MRHKLESFIKQLRDENESVRRNAVIALGWIGEPAVPALIEALGDEDMWVSVQADMWAFVQASQALGEIGEAAQAAVPRLTEALGSNKYIRESAAQALSQIGEPAVPSLIKILSNDDYEVREIAAWALRKIQTPEAMKAVEEYEKRV